MYLLHTETQTIHEFIEDDIPKYAILSHRWESPTEELTFRDVRKNRMRSETSGFRKMMNACGVAKDKYRLDYIWIDTCCINKESSAELSEAINSMFQWYKNAVVCFAFLNDVPSEAEESADAFRQSRWFTRAWTLQELIAPRTLEFYNMHWKPIGTKAEKFELIEEITGIPRLALQDADCLWQFNLIAKMNWASERQATRKEDIAYSLMGIFDVNIPLLYGEGSRAFTRLQEEIIRQGNNTLFLLWGLDQPTQKLLADSPRSFESDESLFSYSSIVPCSWTNIGLQLDVELFRCGIDLYSMPLAYLDGSRRAAICLILRKTRFLENTYHKVCTTVIKIYTAQVSRQKHIIIMRGTKDQDLGAEDPEYGQYDLVRSQYLVEIQCSGDMKMELDNTSITPWTEWSVPRWRQVESEKTYEATFSNPCWWTIACVKCCFAGSGNLTLSFAFDYDWKMCILVEYLTSQIPSDDASPAMLWKRLAAGYDPQQISTVRDGWCIQQGREVESSNKDGSAYFIRMDFGARSCSRLRKELCPRDRDIWLSLQQPFSDEWVLTVSETAPTPAIEGASLPQNRST